MAASVWFSVLVLCLLQQVFAWTCPTNLEDITDSCNECIRCGGIWCSDPTEDIRCSEGNDAWCTLNRTQGLFMPSFEQKGSVFNFRHFERSVKAGASEQIVLEYAAHQANCSMIDIGFVNSTIPVEYSGNFVIENRNIHQNGQCSIYIVAKPNTEFCPPYGITEEYITFKIKVPGVNEEATVRFHVPCACDCSRNVEVKSPKCSNNGDFACGACSCSNGWGGIYCEEKSTVHCDRGDVPCTNSNSDAICSNNGVCTCGSCECFYEKEGSHYYDDYCSDICTVAGSCDSCMRLPKIGRCHDCPNDLYVEPYNVSLMGDMYTVNRKVWIECTEITEEYNIKYAVRKDAKGLHVMIIDESKADKQGPIPGGVKIIIPAVLGILALAAVVATAGVLMWKHRSPPLPLTNPQYENIGAEDCTGVNPLYKPPTSSFKNPTYGKW